MGTIIVDTLRLRIVPTLLGAGRTVAPKDLGVTALELVRSQRFPAGLVVNEYAVRRPER